MTYSEKLRDPRWQKRRLEILARDKFECQQCGATDKTLHIHHKAYLPKTEPWDHPDWLLETLCAECHGEQPGLWNAASHDFCLVLQRAGVSPFDLSDLVIHIAHGVPRLPAEKEFRKLFYYAVFDVCHGLYKRSIDVLSETPLQEKPAMQVKTEG